MTGSERSPPPPSQNLRQLYLHLKVQTTLNDYKISRVLRFRKCAKFKNL